jgi:hypothetical protein
MTFNKRKIKLFNKDMIQVNLYKIYINHIKVIF